MPQHSSITNRLNSAHHRLHTAQVDRNTITIGTCDVNLSFGAHPAEITGAVRFLHPLHNFALVAYDPAALPPEARSKVAAATLHGAPALARGEPVWLVGLTKSLRLMQRRSTVTSASVALAIPAAEVPRCVRARARAGTRGGAAGHACTLLAVHACNACRSSHPHWRHSRPSSHAQTVRHFCTVISCPLRFRAVHEEVVKLDQDFGATFSGVLTDEQGAVRALWGSYAEQVRGCVVVPSGSVVACVGVLLCYRPCCCCLRSRPARPAHAPAPSHANSTCAAAMRSGAGGARGARVVCGPADARVCALGGAPGGAGGSRHHGAAAASLVSNGCRGRPGVQPGACCCVCSPRARAATRASHYHLHSHSPCFSHSLTLSCMPSCPHTFFQGAGRRAGGCAALQGGAAGPACRVGLAARRP